MKIAACVIVKNEERDISEWIAYHSLIGFDSLIVYNNGSTDNTYAVIDRMRRFIDIKIIDWPRNSKYSQLEAYDDCIKNFRKDFDWIAFIDSDEFVNPIADGSIKDLLSYHQKSDAVALNWALFGSAGHDAMPPGFIIEEFTQRAIDHHPVNFHIKIIVRPEKVTRIHNPHLLGVEGRTSHADGTPFVEGTMGQSSSLAGFDLCRVNHYFVRSKAHWAAKMRRGYRELVRPAEHFAFHDTNDLEDRTAARLAPAIRKLLSAIDELPLRERMDVQAGALSEEEKQSEAFISITSTVDDVMFRAPRDSLRPGNTLFDAEWYIATYPDVAASTTPPFQHFLDHGYYEGRRPCSQERIENFLKEKAYRNR